MTLLSHFEVRVACMRSNVKVARQTSMVVSPIPHGSRHYISVQVEQLYCFFRVARYWSLDIDTIPALKSVLIRYWHYSEVGCQPTLGLRTGAVLCQYRASPRPGTNCRIQAFLLVYNWRGTVQFVNTGMNPTFPPGISHIRI